MKKNTILLPLLCCIVATAPLFATEGHSSSSVGAHGDRMPTQSFKEKLKAILVDNPDNGRRLIKELYESQDELHDDLATGGFFTQEELQVLFHFAKKLGLPIIVGKGREGIVHFKIYKGNPIERETKIDLSGNKKLMEFYISDDFEYLYYIDLNNCSLTDIVLPKKLPELMYLDLNNNQLSQIKLPEELPNLMHLNLNNNQLSQIKLPEELPELNYLYLENNQLSQVTLPEELPKLNWMELQHNQLTQLTLPKVLGKRSIYFDIIPSVTAFHNDYSNKIGQHTFINARYQTVMRYVSQGILPKDESYRNSNSQHSNSRNGWGSSNFKPTLSTKDKYYKILGLSPSANWNEVRKAYLNLSRTIHPDKRPQNEKDQATIEFLELHEAYEYLKELLNPTPTTKQ